MLARRLLTIVAALWPCLAGAKVLNVEFKFTPFTGDLHADHVETVPGTARVFLNDVPLTEQEIRKDSLPVLFDEREVGPAVWVPVASLGPAVRKGKNTLRIEFVPADAKGTYQTQLRWASVTDQVTHDDADGTQRSTNQADEGGENKTATGTVVVERSFTADFATDQPWHHAPPVTSVDDADRGRIAALVQARADAFKPDFSGVYALLSAGGDVQVAEIKKRRCLDAAWKAGVRVTAPPAGELDIVTTGHPEVVVRRTKGQLFGADESAFDKIKGDEARNCAGIVLSVAYPPRLVVVKRGDGSWEVVY